MRTRVAILIALVLLLVSAGCADPNPHAEMRLRVDEFSIRFSPATAQDEGAVKMFVDNVGELEHSLVFARAKSASDLPLAPDGSVDLAKAQIADQLKPFGPGKYRIAPEFFPGPLVIFCNLVTKGPDGQPVSHFQRGMHRELGINDTRANDLRTPS
jgi:hypothetical protein